MSETNQHNERDKMNWTAGSHYTLIVEWLRDDERKTGCELAERLRNWSSPVIYRNCHSRTDVLAALNDALTTLRTEGQVPVVHIEAHGIATTGHSDVSGLGGPGQSGGTEYLLWSEMAPLLGELNIASKFQLLVVGAACYGLSALDMFHIHKPAPFAALVGFGSGVHPRRLFESMAELYRQLLRESHRSIPAAVQAANLELSPAADEALITTSFRMHAENVIRTYAYNEFEPSYRRSENQRLVEIAHQLGVQVTLEQMAALQKTTAIRRCQESVDTWFAYSDIPVNRDKYRIDVEQIFQQELSKYG